MGYTERIEKQKGRLAEEYPLDVGGWSGHPYQPDTTDDRQARAIAMKFLHLFTQGMHKKGYMPVVGAEVNGVCEDDETSYIENPDLPSRDSDNSPINATITEFLNGLVGEEDAVAHRNDHTSSALSTDEGVRKLQKLIDGLREWSASDPFEEGTSEHDERVIHRVGLNDINSLIGFLKDEIDQKNFYQMIRTTAQIAGQVLSLARKIPVYIDDGADDVSSHYPLREAWMKTLSELSKLGHAIEDSLPDIQRKMAASIDEKPPTHPFAENGDINGRVYCDCSEVEICTPAMAPYALADCVDSYKRILFEATDSFEEMQGVETEEDAQRLERHPLSLAIRNHVHANHNPFDISFADLDDASGEHISLSFQHDPEGKKNYDTVRSKTFVTDEGGVKLCFGRDNLMKHENWRMLFKDALSDYVFIDALLAVGNASSLDFNERRREIIENAEDSHDEGATIDMMVNADRAARVEMKSFHYSCSNIALSLMAVCAISYAVIKTIAQDGELSARLAKDPASLSLSDNRHIKRALREHFPVKSHCFSDESFDDCNQRFKNNGLTLKMMHELVDDMIPEAERDGWHKEVHRFADLVSNRSKTLLDHRDIGLGLGCPLL